jgi:hypothetical protein
VQHTAGAVHIQIGRNSSAAAIANGIAYSSEVIDQISIFIGLSRRPHDPSLSLCHSLKAPSNDDARRRRTTPVVQAVKGQVSPQSRP